MSKVFLITVPAIQIPVVADSAEEAMECLLENPEFYHEAASGVLNTMFDEETHHDDLDTVEITADSLKAEHAHLTESVPWGDGGFFTVEERVIDEELMAADDESYEEEPEQFVESWDSL